MTVSLLIASRSKLMTASTALSSKQCTVYQPCMRHIRQLAGNQTLGLCGATTTRQLSVSQSSMCTTLVVTNTGFDSRGMTISLLPNVFIAAQPKATFDIFPSIQYSAQ